MATKSPPKRVGFKDAKTRPAGSNQKAADLVELVKPTSSYKKYRFLDMAQVDVIWVTKKVRDKATNKKKEVNFPLFPPDNEAAAEIISFYGEKARSTTETYINCIMREEQKTDPKPKQSGEWLEKGEGYSPVKVMRLPLGCVSKLKDIMDDFNKGADLIDPDKGCDIKISFDKERPASDMYRFAYAKRTPLTAKEKQYAIWNLDTLCKTTSRSDIAKRLVEEGYDGILLDDVQSDKPAPKKVKSKDKVKAKGKVKKRRKSADPDSDEIPF